MNNDQLQYAIECVTGSKLREKSLRCLWKHSAGMAASDVLHEIRTDASSFTGVMIGNGRKFSKEKALIPLGLVRREKTNGKYTYYITDDGNIVLQHIEKEDKK